MDPEIGVAQGEQIGVAILPRAVGEGDDDVGRPRAPDHLREAFETAKDGDRVGSGVDRELPSSAGSVDVADDPEAGPGAFVEDRPEASEVSTRADDQDPAGMGGADRPGSGLGRVVLG